MAKKVENKKRQQIRSTSLHDKNEVDKYILFALAAILIATFAIYFKAIHFDFIFNWDDQDYIIDNPDIKNLSFKNIKGFFIGFYNSNYQPVTMLLYAIGYKLGNGSATVFHLFNIVIHLLNIFLVFKLISALSQKNNLVALITASLFAVHPMHVESVAWISELKDVLYTFFFLISLIAYTQFLKTNKTKDLSIVFIFLLLSCLSKSAAVILPLVLLLIDYYTNRILSWKTILEKAPFFAISLIFGIVAIRSQGSAIKEMAPDMSVIEHLALVSFSFCSYVIKAVLPFNLSALYPYPVELESSLPIIYYISIFVLFAIFIFVWISQKWGKEVLFGFSFFLITIILVIQLVPVGAASMADRYTYIPYIGLFYIIAKLIDFLLNKYEAQKNILSGILILVLISYSTLSYSRVNVWKNDDTLFSDVINKYPHCSIAYLNKGTYFVNYLIPLTTTDSEKNSFKKSARFDFENALKYPLSDANKARAYLCLGKTNGALNEPEKAVDELTKSIEIDPAYRGLALIERGAIYLNDFAGKLFINDTANKNRYLKKSIHDFETSLKFVGENKFTKAIIYCNIGIAQSRLGRLQEAMSSMDLAIKYNPKDLNVYFNRCGYNISLGNRQGAIADCDQIIHLDPQNVKAHFDKAYIKYEMSDFKGAITDIGEVIKLDKNNSTAYTLRANAYNNLKDYKNATDDYNKAIQLNPNDQVAINNIDRISMLSRK